MRPESLAGTRRSFSRIMGRLFNFPKALPTCRAPSSSIGTKIRFSKSLGEMLFAESIERGHFDYGYIADHI